jgi:hypothetical protein
MGNTNIGDENPREIESLVYKHRQFAGTNPDASKILANYYTDKQNHKINDSSGNDISGTQQGS